MRNPQQRARLGLAVLLAAVAGGAGISLPIAAGAQGFEEIVVTARKREESLQESPATVTALTVETIANRQIRTVSDVARYTPGLSLADAFGRATERPVIRGLGNVLAGVQFGVESGTAYFVDGVYYPGDIGTLNIDSVERVEVIRGPQSALYGRNTYAGAVNFVTRKPGDRFYGDVKLRAGSDNDYNGSIGVSGPIIEGKLAASLFLRSYSFDGEYTNVITGNKVGDEETNSLSGVLHWTPTEQLSLTGRVSYQRNRDGTRAFFLQPSAMNNCFPGTRSLAAWPNASGGSTNNFQYYCGDVERPGDTVALNDGPLAPGRTAPLVPGIVPNPAPGFGVVTPVYNPQQGVAFSGVHRDLTYASLLGDWDIAGSGWNAVGSFAWRDEELKTGSDSDHSSINVLGTFFGEECPLCGSGIDNAEDYSVELRLDSPQEHRLRGMAGLFFYDQTVESRDITFSKPDGGPVEDEGGVENWAVFGMLEYDLLDNLSASLELRYFEEDKDFKAFDASGATTFSQKASFDGTAPRFSLKWNVSDAVMLYGIYAKGFKPGGLNGEDGDAVGKPEYDQEESDNFELGIKSTLLDGRLIANIAAFFIDAQKIQLTTPLASGGGTLTSIVTNQGDGEVTGVEVELSWAVNDMLTLGANYALADSEFTKGCDEFQWTLTSGGGELKDATTCTGFVPDVPGSGTGDGSIVGHQFPLSSKHQVSAYADFRREIGRGGLEFFTNLDVSWEDKKPVQVHNLAWVPDATILNGKVGIGGENWSVSLYGRNLTDEDAPSMVTRWLQDPLFDFVGGVGDPSAAGATNCPAGPFRPDCEVIWPRAFFGDMRRGRNYGIEFKVSFGRD
ncbi:MAG: TonB-dependent receptor [Gammaproteobacteria bacterium]|nr:MAG: TonB-dependent receptor [Gammaproteobacteria bacterium]